MTKTIPPDRTYYTTAETAALTGISETTLRKGAKTGDPGALSLRPLHIRETWTWSRAAVDRWVRGETETAA
ncbi:helix-turn-helix domain-containing protein [Corynebacterium provencense]|uniref:helix-turn-helix domain-containing protein n=1 Tax=Corynebacterium provencense TaxID=1737425 RepID=UPI0008347CA4|nr:helix-turn-helix domain-containing protein [Corynebacterium provencense]